MERAVFDNMAEVDAIHWWYVARRDILKEIITRKIRPKTSARILEIGCGTGHNLAMLKQFGTVDATELDAEARTLASRRLGKPVHDGALPGLATELTPGFDLIALLDVLEHVQDDAGALAAIFSLLREGGSLLLTVPINQWMWTSHDVANHHHRRYTVAGIKRLAREAGFEIDFISPFNSLLFLPIAVARVIGIFRGAESADDALPSSLVNRLLRTVFGLEQHLIGRIPFPFGVSSVAILRRPALTA